MPPLSQASCPCGSPLYGDEPEVVKPFAWGRCSFRRCRACGAFFQCPDISTEQLSAWFSSAHYQGGAGTAGSAYLDYRADEANRHREAEGRCRRDLLPWLPEGGSVLEIGCASGALLAVLRDAGMRVDGVDLSEEFARQAQEVNGLPVRVGDFLSMPIEAGRYDAVLLMGTVSNLRRLPDQLARIATVLKDRGLLIFNFPACDSWIARLYGRRHWMFAPSAAQFLSAPGCRRVLERAGFEVAAWRTDRQQPSLSKLLHHARLRSLVAAARLAGLDRALVPIPIPIPGVTMVWARRRT